MISSAIALRMYSATHGLHPFLRFPVEGLCSDHRNEVANEDAAISRTGSCSLLTQLVSS